MESNNIRNAVYISHWDSSIAVRSSCRVNMATREVFDIQVVEIDGVEVLDKEVIELDGKEYLVYEEDLFSEISKSTDTNDVFWRR